MKFVGCSSPGVGYEWNVYSTQKKSFWGNPIVFESSLPFKGDQDSLNFPGQVTNFKAGAKFQLRMDLVPSGSIPYCSTNDVIAYVWTW